MLAAISPFLRKSLLQRPPICSIIRSHIRHYADAPSVPAPKSKLNPLIRPSDRTWDGLMAQIPMSTLPQLSVDEIWQAKSQQAKIDLSVRPPANPYSGRSVKVFGGDVGDAYRRLHGILQRNKVRAQLRRAERHEKKGEKRRRLSSERWRRQFAHEVRKKVQLVTKIRNRGA
ncbi:hypothetical protein Hypma_011581 [Hypsizygus marmoreus]|uniref:37S ribosomal protein mrp21, mitochondrial n=1 Tax=Hypsizygus marmoreus TaxID=39966 RepID=A0A369JN03_HYPMA|nr:hypothetical protein Hypma_011581 [Hypsizygus marmoreus]